MDRPPSRLSASSTAHGAGEPKDSAFPRAASEQEEVFPIHQRDFPSVRMMERRADLPLSRPEMGLLFSRSNGPAWMSSRDDNTEDLELRRVMERAPEALSRKMPFPSDEAEFHSPAFFPAEMTSPRGAPSGVKKPALIARSAFFDFARAADETKVVPGPPA